MHFFNNSGTYLINLADFRPWIIDIGKDHRWSAENAVFRCNAFINIDVVLYFAFVAYIGIRINDDIMAAVTVSTDFGIRQYMCE